MRYRTLLIIATIALLEPASLAQVENAAQTDKAPLTKPVEKRTPCPQIGKAPEMPVTRSVLALRYQPGQSLIVRMNNHDERVGKLLELESDYFLLSSSKGPRQIAYVDVASVKKWSLGWRIGKILLMPVKAPLYGALYGGFYTLVGIGYFGEWITGHRSEY